ncbi:MAG: hypothetical protein AAB410_00630 [Patescibacteria group bacterium]
MSFEDIYPSKWSVSVPGFGGACYTNPGWYTVADILVDFLSQLNDTSSLVMDNPDKTSKRPKIVNYQKLGELFEIVSESAEEKQITIRFK